MCLFARLFWIFPAKFYRTTTTLGTTTQEYFQKMLFCHVWLNPESTIIAPTPPKFGQIVTFRDDTPKCSSPFHTIHTKQGFPVEKSRENAARVLQHFRMKGRGGTRTAHLAVFLSGIAVEQFAPTRQFA